MEQISINMTLAKSTKGTHVYNDDGQRSAVRSIYIRKEGLPDSPPLNIELTIQERKTEEGDGNE